MREILVTGASGLVGSRFVELYPHPQNLLVPDLDEFDLTHPGEYLAKNTPDVVLNLAAYTNVSEAEKQRDDKSGPCWQINVEGTRNLVTALPANARLIHISTDMVFSGSASDPGPYSADHQPETDSQKLTWYGYTKGEGERIVRQVLGREATILRIIYPVRAKYEGKLDYIRKPLNLYDEGKLYPLLSDQQISITFIDEACRALDKIITGSIKGTFHASSMDVVTPFELISKVLEKTRGVSNAVSPIALDDFLREKNIPNYRYPRMGGLSVGNSEQQLDLKFSSWVEIIEILVSQGLGSR